MLSLRFMVDLDNDGKARELLPQFGALQLCRTAGHEIKNKAWVKHVVSPKGYGHGIGAGDINGDGRTDVLTPKGWLEYRRSAAGELDTAR